MKLCSRPFLMFVCAAAVALAGCIKMPKSEGADPDGPDGPDEPDFPPPRNTFIRMAMNPVT